MGDIMAIENSFYESYFKNLCSKEDLQTKGDLVKVVNFSFTYKKLEKRFRGWQIIDIDKYKLDEERCLTEYNSFLRVLDQYKIDYDAGRSDKLLRTSSMTAFTTELLMKASWTITIFIGEDRKQWFFKLIGKLKNESLIKNMKTLAGPWYERIKDTKPARDMVTDAEQILRITVDYAYNNYIDKISIVSRFINHAVLVNAGDHRSQRGNIFFEAYGYQDMNNEQLAALEAIYIEAAHVFCSHNDKLLCEEYVKSKGLLGETEINTILYLKETKPLKSW